MVIRNILIPQSPIVVFYIKKKKKRKKSHVDDYMIRKTRMVNILGGALFPLFFSSKVLFWL